MSVSLNREENLLKLLMTDSKLKVTILLSKRNATFSASEGFEDGLGVQLETEYQPLVIQWRGWGGVTLKRILRMWGLMLWISRDCPSST